MFCPKCGTKAIEDAAFCQKCGFKLEKDTEPVEVSAESVTVSPPKSVEEITATVEQISETDQETHAPGAPIPTPEDPMNIYTLLKDNVKMYPTIKSVKQAKNGIILRSGIYKHFVTIASNQARIGTTLAFPLSILYGLSGGLICYIVSSISWGFMDYGSFYWEDFYSPLLALCFLITGLTIIIHTFCGKKGKADVVAYVQGIVESYGIALKPSTGTEKSGKPVKGLITAIVLMLAGSIILMLPITENINFNTSEDVSTTISRESELPDSEDISLTQTYNNEEEGFSFMYPWDWAIEDVNDVNPNAFVSVASAGMLGVYARICVTKDHDDGSSFAMTKLDWELAFETQDNISDAKVTELKDDVLDGYPARKVTLTVKNADGVPCILIYYFYIINSDVYIVTCMSVEDSFDKQGPVLDAIMDSYTVTSPPSTGAPVNGIQVNSMEEARNLIEDWMMDHPLYGELSGVAERSDNGTDSSGNAAYVFDLWLAPREHAGLVYVRKSDGYMSLKELDSNTEMSLDDWYEVWSSPFH